MNGLGRALWIGVLSGLCLGGCGGDDTPDEDASADSATDTALDCALVGCAPPPAPGEECTAPCGCCSGPVDSGTPDAPADAPTDAPPTDAGGDISCGTMTCGADTYCYIECTCCGVDSGTPPSADYSCRPIPTGCDAADLCSCDLGLDCGSCSGTRTVQCPCA